MSIDKITQFELGIIELNRNIAYREKDQISKNYNQLNSLYQEILKLDIPIEQKRAMYDSVIETHKNIQDMNQPRQFGALKIAGVALAILLSGFFLFNGPEATGMVVYDGMFANSVTRFAPVSILVILLVFLIIKKKKEN